MALRQTAISLLWSSCNPEQSPLATIPATDSIFEPVTLEDVLEIINIENRKGVIVQYGEANSAGEIGSR